jgi:histidine kinase
MKMLSGYELVELINQDTFLFVYRARKLSDAGLCIIKCTANEDTLEESAMFLRNEHAITSQLNLSGIIKSKDLVREDDDVFVIQEDTATVPLFRTMSAWRYNIPLFLSAAMHLCDLLHELHKRGIIHKNLSPASIFVDPVSGECALSNFYVSSWAIHDRTVRPPQHFYAHTLPYISPEQTGRTNFSIDFRSDFYSLGIVFYEMLTGNAPFRASEPIEFMYSHVAKQPVALPKVAPEIPLILSDIILKLLTKSPDGRYKSALGLKADFKECLSQFERSGTISGIVLGSYDYASHLAISDTLFGRETELSHLHDAFQNASQGKASAVLISGPGGVGKTHLIEEFKRLLPHEKVLLMSGKCDEATSNVPYFGLSRALAEAIHAIISQGEKTIEKWRDRLSEATDGNGELIAQVVPEIEFIIGPRAHRAVAPEFEAQNRFRSAFIKFLRAFAGSDAVLVLVIDDLQWADSALLTILKPAFFEDSQCPILFIGAGRLLDGATDEFEKGMKTNGNAITKIALSPLGQKETCRIISDSLKCSNDQVRQLNDVLFEKTGGNPQFLKEYLKTLYRHQLLRRFGESPSEKNRGNASDNGKEWEWDIEGIRQLDIAENVIGLVVDKVSHLSQGAQTVVQWAACCGGSGFYAEMLAKAFGTGIEEVTASLDEGAEGGVFSECKSPWIFPLESEPHGAGGKKLFRFSHDRVREAIYSQLDQRKRSDIHLQWGRYLLALYWDGSTEASSFEIANHFNQFEATIQSPDERRELVRLNTEAGTRAMESNAYEIALNYLHYAVRFLSADSWKTGHSIRFKLELSIGECECMLNRFEAAQKRLASAAVQACTPLEHGSLSLVALEILNGMLKFEDAVQKGINGLRALGISTSLTPSIGQMLGGFFKALGIMWRRKPASFLGKEIMQPPEGQRLVLRLLVRVWELSFMLSRQMLMVSMVFHMIVFTRKYGNQSASAIAYCCWGIFLSLLFRNPGRGLPYAKMASELADYFNDPYVKGKTQFLRAGFYSHLEGHLSQAVEAYKIGLKFSIEAGDILNTAMCREGITLMIAFLGKPLTEVKKFAEESCSYLMEKGWGEKSLYVQFVVKEWIQRLQSKILESGNPLAGLNGEKPIPMEKGVFLVFELFRAFLAGDWAEAGRCSRELKGNAIVESTGYYYALVCFLSALTISMPLKTGNVKAPLRGKKALRKYLRRLGKFSDRCSANFLCMWLLVKAELLRLEEKYWDAAHFYQKAIEEAQTREFVHFQAIACEAAGRFYWACGNKLMSRLLFKQAISSYGQWEAHGKVALLRNEFPGVPAHSNAEITSGSTLSASVDSLMEIDFSAFMKAVEAISTEIILDRLLERLVRIVIENAGAQRGVVILKQDGEFLVRIEGVLSSLADPVNPIEAHALALPVGQATLPHGIISFVERTREPVRLENAALSGRFSNDPYIRKSMMKSVLCVPLVKFDTVQGMIYLENSLTEGAFPPSRLQLLKLLSGQAVICLENALFHDLEMKHLQAKVNPHFIFNALSSVADLCHENPHEAENAIVKLSVLYRYILTAEMRFVTIEEELDIVQKYLAIEKLRFGNRLNFSVHVIGDAGAVKIPCMLIQPLVENSIKHGISPRSSGGSIVITVVVAEKTCTISVADDGIGMNTKKSGTGYGHASIKKRLALQYGSDFSFVVRESNGYIVEMTFPVLIPKGRNINAVR